MKLETSSTAREDLLCSAGQELAFNIIGNGSMQLSFAASLSNAMVLQERRASESPNFIQTLCVC